MPDTPRSLAQRILGVMQAVSYIQKLDKTVNGQYRYVSHDQVVGALRKPMVENGIIAAVTVVGHTQDGNRTTADVEVSLINADDPNDKMAVRAFGYGCDPADKGAGKAISYAVKLALLKLFMLETGEDPDHDASPDQQQKVADNSLDAALDRKARMKSLLGLISQLAPDQREQFKARYPNGTRGLRDTGLNKLEAELKEAIAGQLKKAA